MIFGGKDVSVKESYADPKDKGFKWCEVTVDKAEKGKATYQYGGAPYRLSPDKNPAILHRGDGDQKKDLKKGAWVLVEASTSTDKPENEKEERPAFHATKIIVLEARLRGWYQQAILDE